MCAGVAVRTNGSVFGSSSRPVSSVGKVEATLEWAGEMDSWNRWIQGWVVLVWIWYRYEVLGWVWKWVRRQWSMGQWRMEGGLRLEGLDRHSRELDVSEQRWELAESQRRWIGMEGGCDSTASGIEILGHQTSTGPGGKKDQRDHRLT